MSRRIAFTMLLSALLLVPATHASWSAGPQWDTEPTTSLDDPRYMEFDPDWSFGPDKIYFSAFLIPVSQGGNEFQVAAYLGHWKDCNRDGYVGMGASASDGYPSALLPPGGPCVPGTPHVSGGFVTEFFWIGPGSLHYDDPYAVVWADAGNNTTPGKSGPDDELVFSAYGGAPQWRGNRIWTIPPLERGFGWVTTYAFVSASGTPGHTGHYGSDHCPGNLDGWNCSGPGEYGIRVGDPYQLRDVDCYVVDSYSLVQCP